MDIVLSHFSALEALRAPSLRKRLNRSRCAIDLPDRAPTKAELAELIPRLPQSLQSGNPPEILLAHDAPRTRPLHVKTHRALDALPELSAVQIAPDVRCVSPEHLVVQLAPLLTEMELVCLLSELLGTYAIVPNVTDGMFKRREPLTTPDLITAHIELLGPAPGTAKVRQALSISCVGSASPRETKLSLRLGLSKHRGGEGLKVLSMNDPIQVRMIHDAMRKGVRKPDILLLCPTGEGRDGKKRRGVAVEYDGKDHDGAVRHARDAARHNELVANGIDEIIVTAAQYSDQDYMDGLAKTIREMLGVPEVRVKRSVAEKRRKKREELCRELEGIDGVHWSCFKNMSEDEEDEEAKEGAGDDTRPRADNNGWDVVPVEAYMAD
ncbi:hypothetical protein [Olsenella sp. An293]|uniref:hypothetical protein n=1 Tax=Olsenella sp. An293 TaxID=1965626 RepID=UPI00117DC4F9|nr:hypothetical protein [Olsenella sp. An293]